MRLRIVAALGLAIVALTGCASVATEPDQQGLLYQGGPIDGRKLDTCVKPGTTEYGDLIGGNGYVYPVGQRTYEFSGNEGAEQGPITLVDKDGVEMTVSGLLPFTLTDDCKLLTKFHERIGLQYGANADDVPTEWVPLLRKYLGTPLDSVMVATAKEYGWRELRDNQATRDQWFQQILDELGSRVDTLAGGAYFDGFSLEIPKVEPSEEMRAQIREQQVQAERVNTINAQKEAQDAEIAQMRQLIELMGPQGYILYRQQIACENGGNCPQFVPIPQGSNLNVTPGG